MESLSCSLKFNVFPPVQSSLIYKYYINHSYVTAVFKPSVSTERDHYLVVFFLVRGVFVGSVWTIMYD